MRSFFERYGDRRDLHSFPTRRSSDLGGDSSLYFLGWRPRGPIAVSAASMTLFSCLGLGAATGAGNAVVSTARSEEHTSELQSQFQLVCRLLLEKKNPATFC